MSDKSRRRLIEAIGIGLASTQVPATATAKKKKESDRKHQKREEVRNSLIENGWSEKNKNVLEKSINSEKTEMELPDSLSGMEVRESNGGNGQVLRVNLNRIPIPGKRKREKVRRMRKRLKRRAQEKAETDNKYTVYRR